MCSVSQIYQCAFSFFMFLLVISVALCCSDLNLLICQLSPDSYHKLETDWSRIDPSAQLSFCCPLKLEEKSSDLLSEVMKL